MWMNWLQMNDTNIEFIIFGTSNLLNKIDLVSITVREITVYSKLIKFLSAILDETLSFRQHVAARANLAL